MRRLYREKELENLPQLPSWLQELLPEKRVPAVLAVAEDGVNLKVTFPNGETKGCLSLQDAHETFLASETCEDLYVDEGVYELLNEKLFLGYPTPGNRKTTTMVLSSTDEDRELTLRRGYDTFLHLEEEYRKDPQNFVRAWHFIDKHPAFWTAHNLEKHPWHWEQEGYASKLTQYVVMDEKSPTGYSVELEAGGHVPHDELLKVRYKTHYGDWRLEVAGASFEDAVVILAARVAQVFNSDGTDVPKEKVNLKKPKWIVELEERLRELDEE